MQITRLVIENLRAVERLELNLADDAGQPRRRAVILGVNGAGKTTILDALAHAFESLAGSSGGAGAGATTLGAADVRNVDDPSLEPEARLRQGVIMLDAVLSQDERNASRRMYPTAPSKGELHFQVGAERSEDLFDDVDFDPIFPEDGDQRDPSSTVDAMGVEEGGLEDFLSSFEGAARAALSSARAPCVLLPADRGVLEPSDDLTLGEIRAFDPRAGCLSRATPRFSATASSWPTRPRLRSGCHARRFMLVSFGTIFSPKGSIGGAGPRRPSTGSVGSFAAFRCERSREIRCSSSRSTTATRLRSPRPIRWMSSVSKAPSNGSRQRRSTPACVLCTGHRSSSWRLATLAFSSRSAPARDA